MMCFLNMFNKDFLNAISPVLDRCRFVPNNRILVTTSSTGLIYPLNCPMHLNRLNRSPIFPILIFHTTSW